MTFQLSPRVSVVEQDITIYPVNRLPDARQAMRILHNHTRLLEVYTDLQVICGVNAYDELTQILMAETGRPEWEVQNTVNMIRDKWEKTYGKIRDILPDTLFEL